MQTFPYYQLISPLCIEKYIRIQFLIPPYCTFYLAVRFFSRPSCLRKRISWGVSYINSPDWPRQRSDAIGYASDAIVHVTRRGGAYEIDACPPASSQKHFCCDFLRPPAVWIIFAEQYRLSFFLRVNVPRLKCGTNDISTVPSVDSRRRTTL
ncbi:hypothetical protein Trydic_g20737 [Trypoxylus dichotomus]